MRTEIRSREQLRHVVWDGEDFFNETINALIDVAKSTGKPGSGWRLGQEGLLKRIEDLKGDPDLWFPCASTDDVDAYGVVEVYDSQLLDDGILLLVRKALGTGKTLYAGCEDDDLFAGSYGWVKLITPYEPVECRTSDSLGAISFLDSLDIAPTTSTLVKLSGGRVTALTSPNAETGHCQVILSQSTASQTGDPNTGDGTGDDAFRPNSRDCVYPGSNISELCPICPCSADPWVIDPGPIECGNAEVGGPRALFLIDDSMVHCVWQSDEFFSDYRSFHWTMTIMDGDPKTATLELWEDSGGYEDPRVIETWYCDRYCCECRNCFELRCGTIFPPPCLSLPEKICLSTPHFAHGATVDMRTSSLEGACYELVEHCPEVAQCWWVLKADGSPDVDSGIRPKCGGVGPQQPPCFSHALCGVNPGSGLLHCVWTMPQQPLTPDCTCFGESQWLQNMYFEPTGGGPYGTDPIMVYQVTYRPDGSPEFTYTYHIDLADFDCDGPNTFTNVDPYSAGSGHVTLVPLEGLTDAEGDFIFDYDGFPIEPAAHESCDPSSGACYYKSFPGLTDYLPCVWGKITPIDPSHCPPGKGCPSPAGPGDGGIPGLPDAALHCGEIFILDCVPV